MQAADYVEDVRPILQKHCYQCHGEEKQKSGLRLDVKEAAFHGGDAYGESIVPGKPDQSPLIQFIRSTESELRMPPGEDRLSEDEISLLVEWVASGAKWPEGVDKAKLENRMDHWSFRPLEVSQEEASIDAFIVEKLRECGLNMSGTAGRREWLRRVSIDLTGLPPSLQEMQEFESDGAENAFEKVIDRLLQSPRYGERWAQHWLDVVRYADTHGFEVNTERPNAFHYRDYVIRAFNENTPYDRFVREQIVGDALGKDDATGFLVTASVLLPAQIGQDEPSIRLARQDSIDEIVNNVAQTFLGLSVGCARCHDHKFDPITAKDYYSMQAFVAGVHYGDRERNNPEAESVRQDIKKLHSRLTDIDHLLSYYVPLAKSGGMRPMVNARKNVDRFVPVTTKRIRFTIRATNSLEPCIDELEIFNTMGQNVALSDRDAKVLSSGDTTVADRHELRFIHDGVYGNSRSWMSNENGKGWVTVELASEQEIDRVVWGRDRESKFNDRLATEYSIEVASSESEWTVVAEGSDRLKFDPKQTKTTTFSTDGLTDAETVEAEALVYERKQIDARIAALEKEHKSFAGVFRSPDKIYLLSRGNPEQPKEEVVPAVLSSFGSLALEKDTSEQERRIQLADWLASKQNPFTARVMVNRIWQGHFGVGIVSTPSDFGRSGSKPSHPELLDWLASRFIESGWDIKQLHRTIVLSDVYRQSSSFDQKASEIDADNRLLWRYPTRRMEAEAIRDSVLSVSGQLNCLMFGSGFNLFDQRGGLSGFTPVEKFSSGNLRRMIYAHKVRREVDAVFGAFDCPDAGQSMAIRRASTTPIQALNLFNSRFMIDQSEAFANRVQYESGDDLKSQIIHAYRLALTRDPTEDEKVDCLPVVKKYGIAVLGRAIFNSNEFLFIP